MSPPTIVFIDTQVYERKRFRFSAAPLSSIAKIAQEKRISLVTTSIVGGEVERHLRAKADSAHGLLQSVLKDKHLLPDRREFDELAEITVEDAQRAAVDRWNEFVESSRMERIGARYARMQKLVSMFFKETPPFDSGKKKNEFPDAISLLSLIGRFPEERIAVISGDKGIAEWCKRRRSFIHYIDIETYLNDFFSEDEIADIARSYAGQSEENLKDVLTAQFAESGFSYEPQIEADVYDVEVHSVDVSEVDVVEVDGDEVLFTGEAILGFTARAIGPDYETAIYDKEDGKYYFFQDFEAKLEHAETVAFSFRVEVDRHDVAKSELFDIQLDETDFVIPEDAWAVG